MPSIADERGLPFARLRAAVAFLCVVSCGGRDALPNGDVGPHDAASLDVGVDDADLDTGATDGGPEPDAGSDGCASCACVPGETMDCYTGPSSTLGVGVCASGKRTCQQSGDWGDCADEVLPSAENCGTLFDDDCDGEVNEAGVGCACTPGATAPCYAGPPATLGIGVCMAGVQTCDLSGSAWGSCEGQVVPTMEDCPSLDDEDCDGLVNETGLNCVCKPGEQMYCYTGPPATQDVGICSSGLATCATDGMSYGPCTGETLPTQEDCGGDDEDCDGESNEEGPSCVCKPEQLGSTCYTGPQAKLGVGICQAGKLFCESSGLGYDGYCYDEVLPVNENCAAPTDEDCDGKTAASCAQPVWTKALPPNTRIHVDTLGTGVWLAGMSSEPTDFGGGVLPSGGGSDAWVVRFDGDANHLWSRRFPGAGYESVRGLAVGPSGESVLVGGCTGNAVFDSFSFDCTSTGKVYVIKISPSGTVAWAKVYGLVGGWQVASPVDLDASGNVIFGGIHRDAIDFGGGPLPKPTNAATFLAKLDSDGNHVFSKSFEHTTTTYVSDDWIADVAALSTGGIVMAGKFAGSFDLGGGTLSSTYSSKAYVGRFDSQGVHVWSKSYEQTQLSRMRLSPAGTIFLTGYHSAPVSFGPTPVTGSGFYLVELTPTGAHLWSGGFAIAGAFVDIRALAVRSGSPFILGGSGNYVDLGFGTGPQDGGYLIGMDYGPNVLWQYPEQKLVDSVAYDSVGHLYAAGSNYLWKLSP